MQNTSTDRRFACAVMTGQKPVAQAIELLIEAGFGSEAIRVLLAGADEDEDELYVQLRTGVRRALPIAAMLGALAGLLFAFYDTSTNIALPARLVTGFATGGFLGAMAGIVLGLGHWEHFVELPEDDGIDHSIVIAVELAASERAPAALAALAGAGGTSTALCSDEEAWELVEATPHPTHGEAVT